MGCGSSKSGKIDVDAPLKKDKDEDTDVLQNGEVTKEGDILHHEQKKTKSTDGDDDSNINQEANSEQHTTDQSKEESESKAKENSQDGDTPTGQLTQNDDPDINNPRNRLERPVSASISRSKKIDEQPHHNSIKSSSDNESPNFQLSKSKSKSESKLTSLPPLRPPHHLAPLKLPNGGTVNTYKLGPNGETPPWNEITGPPRRPRKNSIQLPVLHEVKGFPLPPVAQTTDVDENGFSLTPKGFRPRSNSMTLPPV